MRLPRRHTIGRETGAITISEPPRRYDNNLLFCVQGLSEKILLRTTCISPPAREMRLAFSALDFAYWVFPKCSVRASSSYFVHSHTYYSCPSILALGSCQFTELP